jgi:uncharacterized protein (DUF362 family)
MVEHCDSYCPTDVERAFDVLEPLIANAIAPGDHVVLKPNWLAAHHRYDVDEWQSVITHPAIITEVLKRIAGRLSGRGRITITDGPQTDSSFEAILARMPAQDWKRVAADHGVEFSILDLRDIEWREEGDVVFGRRPLPGDPLGSIEFDLGSVSNHMGRESLTCRYYGADYEPAETRAAHTGGRHCYRLSGTAVSADVFVNLPKLKTHKKAGITCSLKNLVGINTYRNFLPHYTEGTTGMGGDQFAQHTVKNACEALLVERFKRLALRYERCAKAFIPVKRLGRLLFGETKDTIRSGNWYGNDTLWRTILDLNMLLLYGNRDGTLRSGSVHSQKRYISIVDGVVAGQGNGPEAPDPVEARSIIAGSNPLAVDCVAALFMGFDYRSVPSLKEAFGLERFPILEGCYNDIAVSSTSLPAWNGRLADVSAEACLQFRPHFGWVGHVEIRDR